MEPKKNPKADLRRNSSLYFVFGLAVVMALVYGALEWKTYEKTSEYDISLNIEETLDEEVPMTEQIKTPPFRQAHKWAGIGDSFHVIGSPT